MQTERLWILGAQDPEMDLIEEVLAACGEQYRYAMRGGHRVEPSQVIWPNDISSGFSTSARCVDIIDVECRSVDAMRRYIAWPYTRWYTIDHHTLGDPGFGLPPSEFWRASSLGQVVAKLQSIGHHVVVTDHMRRVAAFDHCPEAAARGECPGVSPD